MPHLYIDPLDCTGCRVCELVCSFYKEKVFSPRLSRVRVITLEPALDFPVACRHCDKAPCIAACPMKAIDYDEEGKVVVYAEECIGCGACVDVCPFGAMNLHPKTGVAFNCDLCGKCVEFCPVGKLKIVEEDELSTDVKYKFVKEAILPLVKSKVVKEEVFGKVQGVRR